MGSKLVTVAEKARNSGVFSEGSLRWIIFNAESNGLHKAGALVKLGRRVLIDDDRFDLWVESHRIAQQVVE